MKSAFYYRMIGFLLQFKIKSGKKEDFYRLFIKSQLSNFIQK